MFYRVETFGKMISRGYEGTYRIKRNMYEVRVSNRVVLYMGVSQRRQPSNQEFPSSSSPPSCNAVCLHPCTNCALNLFCLLVWKCHLKISTTSSLRQLQEAPVVDIAVLQGNGARKIQIIIQPRLSHINYRAQCVTLFGTNPLLSAYVVNVVGLPTYDQ